MVEMAHPNSVNSAEVSRNGRGNRVYRYPGRRTFQPPKPFDNTIGNIGQEARDARAGREIGVFLLFFFRGFQIFTLLFSILYRVWEDPYQKN